jgi:hypothetical protein
VKHPYNHQLYNYWIERRGERSAPERAEIEPGAIRRILGDSFILSCDAGEDHLFRVAGTRLCALFGRELRGQPFSSIWDQQSADEVHDLVAIAADEAVGVAAGAQARTADEVPCNFEILLLPLAHRGKIGARMLGLIAAIERPYWLGIWPARPLRLGVIQYLGPGLGDAPPAPRVPKRRILTVIDGGRM